MDIPDVNRESLPENQIFLKFQFKCSYAMSQLIPIYLYTNSILAIKCKLYLDAVKSQILMDMFQI